MPLNVAVAAAKNTRKKTGLALWMERVIEECERASLDFSADPVHDLRVALRRCRSIADGLRMIDPDPAWKTMKKAGRQLFRELGELRDAQVMEEWVRRLGNPDDPVTNALLQFLASREVQLKQQAALGLQEFDRKQWRRWIASLPRRAARMRAESAVFKHLALERWTEAYELHRRALRNRSQVAFHSLRIGLKRFRYVVENFLPEQHEAWSADLKDLQDLLGEVHDLDVLWATALQVIAFPDVESRSKWHARIIEERTRRIEKYRSKMLGKASLWHVWRAQLPVGKQIESAALSRLKLWASFLDPDFKHSSHVSHLALQLYDGLPVRQTPAASEPSDQRAILQVAALLHDVGRSKKEKGHHKVTYNLIQRLTPPLSWNAEQMRWVGIVARYHRGALPGGGQKMLAGLTAGQRRSVQKLAGILRLANAFDANRNGQIQRLEVSERNGFLEIAARGYSPRDRAAEGIAAARHLLETVYRRPVIVKTLKANRVN
ncbi:MAG TPA: CHAD domain-containing protein [Terriglobales bacterium]|jgi:CHAD domain-containing protein|nr:CHAD domain-containing protein [Terriglobales bacterium]